MKCYGLVLNGDSRVRYVGMTEKSLSSRLSQHWKCARNNKLTPVYKWMRKYSKEQISIVEIGSADSRISLQDLEKSLIREYKKIGQADLNIAEGGDGGSYPLTQETKEKISRIVKSAWQDPDKRFRMMNARKNKVKKKRMSRSESAKEVNSRPDVIEKKRKEAIEQWRIRKTKENEDGE